MLLQSLPIKYSSYIKLQVLHLAENGAL